MKARITYKELSLLAGIIVALIILLVIWLHPGETEPAEIGNQFQLNGVLPAVKLVLHKTFILIQLSR